jgi:flagellar basal-body rod protein FlgC
MKVGGDFSGFNISAKGLSAQRKKMDLIAENIANAETTRTDKGTPYKRKFLKTISEDNKQLLSGLPQPQLKLSTTKQEHIMDTINISSPKNNKADLTSEIVEDSSNGELIFMPSHPDADENGYVESSNVNIINEMVEMIQATRNYEANLKALNASKEMIKDSMEI